MEQDTTEPVAQPKAESNKQLELQQMLLHILLSLPLHILLSGSLRAQRPVVQPAAQPNAKADEESQQEPVQEPLPPDAPGLPAVGSGLLGGTSCAQESPKQATQKSIRDEIGRIGATEQGADGGTDKYTHEHAGEPNCQSVICLK